MKKLLTILITLILSVCLINVNTNNIKADDQNDAVWTGGSLCFKKTGTEYDLYICNTSDGSFSKYTTGKGTTWWVDDEVDPITGEKSILVLNGFNFTQPDKKCTYALDFCGSRIKLIGNNSLTSIVHYNSRIGGIHSQKGMIIEGPGSLTINTTQCDGEIIFGISSSSGIVINSGTINIVDEQAIQPPTNYDWTSRINYGINSYGGQTAELPSVIVNGGTININLNRKVQNRNSDPSEVYGIGTNGTIQIYDGKLNINLKNGTSTADFMFGIDSGDRYYHEYASRNVGINGGAFDIDITGKAKTMYGVGTDQDITINDGNFDINLNNTIGVGENGDRTFGVSGLNVKQYNGIFNVTINSLNTPLNGALAAYSTTTTNPTLLFSYGDLRAEVNYGSQTNDSLSGVIAAISTESGSTPSVTITQPLYISDPYIVTTGTYQSGGGQQYPYAHITDKDGNALKRLWLLNINLPPVPEPTPTPKKDESCEKVIGPTWHWNNDKGICEDYGVVGTSTR